MESDDMMKLSPDDHLEVLALLMHMDKFPADFVDSPHDINNLLALSPESAAAGLDLSSAPPIFHTYSPPPNPDPAAGTPRQQAWPAAYAQSGSGRRAASGGGGAASMAEMREMIFRIAAMQPIHIDPEAVKPPKRRNVKISKDPQSVAARHRRERISERIRILQRLVPGGTKMDTASMLDEAIHYVKFLKRQVQTLERVGPVGHNNKPAGSVISGGCLGFPVEQKGSNNNNDHHNML